MSRSTAPRRSGHPTSGAGLRRRSTPFSAWDRTPPEFAREWPDVLTGYEILGTAREAGFDVAAVVRADGADWDRYESGIWQSVLSWLGNHPDHPDRDFMVDYLRRLQDEYFGYGREYMDWALFVLVPGFW